MKNYTAIPAQAAPNTAPPQGEGVTENEKKSAVLSRASSQEDSLQAVLYELSVTEMKPYVKTNKNDYNGAEAVGEAVSRANMRFVPVKTVEQDIQAIHRIRQANQIRGFSGSTG